MTESPTPAGGERAPPTGTTTEIPVHVDLETEFDVDAERSVDDGPLIDGTGDHVDIPIEAPIADVIDQRVAVPFDDEDHPGTS